MKPLLAALWQSDSAFPERRFRVLERLGRRGGARRAARLREARGHSDGYLAVPLGHSRPASGAARLSCRGYGAARRHRPRVRGATVPEPFRTGSRRNGSRVPNRPRPSGTQGAAELQDGDCSRARAGTPAGRARLDLAALRARRGRRRRRLRLHRHRRPRERGCPPGQRRCDGGAACAGRNAGADRDLRR